MQVVGIADFKEKATRKPPHHLTVVRKNQKRATFTSKTFGEFERRMVEVST